MPKLEQFLIDYNNSKWVRKKMIDNDKNFWIGYEYTNKLLPNFLISKNNTNNVYRLFEWDDKENFIIVFQDKSLQETKNKAVRETIRIIRNEEIMREKEK